jgi:hypothetical protein
MQGDTTFKSDILERGKAMNSIAMNVKEIGMLGKTELLLITFLVLVAAIPGTLAAQEPAPTDSPSLSTYEASFQSILSLGHAHI